MIECKNIHFGYSKDPLFNDLSANFENGHIYGLLGKNGAGKTTLLKCIAGLLHLKSGEIDVLGRKSIKKEPEILKDIFFFPENFFLPSLSGEKYYKLYSRFYPNFNEEYFLKTCVDFEIQLDKNLRTLSFGQKKKFYLAFGLSTFAKIMLLDEPTNGLDIPSKTAVRKKIAESLTENQTFIISTHQVRDLSQLFDYIIILHNGKIIFNNSIDYITDNYSIKIKTINQNNEKEEIESIYYEESTIGKIYLVKNKGNNSNIDLEFFFNAAISNPNSIS
ncbi:MAG: ABC transporter ATP-binding protein [Spirochaetota bacterium]